VDHPFEGEGEMPDLQSAEPDGEIDAPEKDEEDQRDAPDILVDEGDGVVKCFHEK